MLFLLSTTNVLFALRWLLFGSAGCGRSRVRSSGALVVLENLCLTLQLAWSSGALVVLENLCLTLQLAFGLTRARPLALEPTLAKLSLGLPCFVFGPLQVQTFDDIECKYNLCLDGALEPGVEELSVDLTRSVYRL